MPAIESVMTINGYAWIQEDTEELMWCYLEDLQDVPTNERPEGCTPVVIEISPADEWVNKRIAEKEYWGGLEDQMSSLKEQIARVQKDLKIGE